MAKKQHEGIISLKEIYHLANLKKCDRFLNTITIKSLCKTLIGSIKSMGVLIKKHA